MNNSREKIRRLTFIGMSGALSALLMFVNIPVPLAPSFMKFDVSELPALFAGFFLSPGSGCAVVAVKLLIKLLFQGSETALVGEAVNMAGSMAFVLPAALIYRRSHTRRGALLAMTAATILVSALSVFLNAWVAFPAYAAVYGIPLEVLVKMGAAVNPLVHDQVSLMLFSVFPFNLVKHGATSAVTYLVYKRCGGMLRSRWNLGAQASRSQDARTPQA